MTERITLRLGPLAGPLSEAATANGVDLSSEIRRRLAESLGVDEPDMRQGFAAMSERDANRARKRSAKARKRSR